MIDTLQEIASRPTLSKQDKSLRLFNRLSARSGLWLGLSWLTLGLPTLIYPIGRDQGVFAYIGQRLLEGSRLYVDLWDVKSPLIYWLYGLALKFSGASVIGIRAMDMVFAGISAYLVYSLTINLRVVRGQRAGIVAGVLYLLWYYLPNDYRVVANCESFMTPFLVLGMLFLVNAIHLREDSAWLKSLALWFWGGVALGATMLFKTTGAVFLAPALAAAFLASPYRLSLRQDMKERIFAVLVVGIGFAFPLVLGWIYLERTGATEDWLFLNLTYLPSYTGVSHAQGLLRELLTPVLIVVDLLKIYPTMVIGLALYGYWVVFNWSRSSIESNSFAGKSFSAVNVVLGLGLSYAAIIAVQGKYLHYHFLPLLGPFAAVVAIGALRILEDFRVKGWVKTCALAVLTLGIAHSWNLPHRYISLVKMVAGSSYSREYCQELSSSNFPCAASHGIGEYLRAESEPGDKLFVWSFEPEIYFLSGLDASSRFLFNTPFLAGEVSAEWKVELMLDLLSEPPDYIVVGEQDGLPLITGERYSSKEQLKEVAGLAEFISSNYTPIETFGDFTILELLVFGATEPNSTSKTLP